MAMDLASASQWAEVLGLITILGAAIYSWVTINEIKKDRNAAASLKLSELWQNTEFAHGSISIWMQPDDLKTFKELEEFHGENYPKVFTVLLTWESIAITLHDGHFDFEVVRKQFSLSMITAWLKNKKIIENFRKEQDNELAFEWLQWIAERMMDYYDRADDVVPAQIAHKDWKPIV